MFVEWNWNQSHAGTQYMTKYFYLIRLFNIFQFCTLIIVLSITWILNKYSVGKFLFLLWLHLILSLDWWWRHHSGLASGVWYRVVIWSYRTEPISNRSSPVLSAITSCWMRVTTRGEAKPSEGILWQDRGYGRGKGVVGYRRQLKSSPNWIQITQLFVSECLKVVRMCDKIMAGLGRRIYIG